MCILVHRYKCFGGICVSPSEGMKVNSKGEDDTWYVEGKVQTVQQPTLLKTSPKKCCFFGGKTPLFLTSLRFCYYFSMDTNTDICCKYSRLNQFQRRFFLNNQLRIWQMWKKVVILINNITAYFPLHTSLLHGPQNIICMVTQGNLTSQNKHSILNVIQTMVYLLAAIQWAYWIIIIHADSFHFVYHKFETPNMYWTEHNKTYYITDQLIFL